MKTDIETLKKAFALFVGNDELRPSLNRPFKQGNLWIATDAHSMIFMDTSIADMGFEEETKLKATAVIPIETNASDIINVAELDKKLIPTMIPAEIECEECQGEGEIHCHSCGHTNDCDDCNGRGYFPDPKGGEMPDQNKDWGLLGIHYKDKQLRRLVQACNILGIDTIKKTFGTKTRSTLFEADKVSFLVMPAYGDDEKINEITV